MVQIKAISYDHCHWPVIANLQVSQIGIYECTPAPALHRMLFQWVCVGISFALNALIALPDASFALLVMRFCSIPSFHPVVCSPHVSAYTDSLWACSLSISRSQCISYMLVVYMTVLIDALNWLIYMVRARKGSGMGQNPGFGPGNMILFMSFYQFGKCCWSC